MNLKTSYFPNICFPDESLKLIVLCQHIVILKRGMFLTNIDFFAGTCAWWWEECRRSTARQWPAPCLVSSATTLKHAKNSSTLSTPNRPLGFPDLFFTQSKTWIFDCTRFKLRNYILDTENMDWINSIRWCRSWRSRCYSL